MTSQGDDASRLDDAAEEREESSTTEGAAATGEDFPPAVNRLHVTLADLFLEQRVGHGDRALCARHQRPRQHEIHGQNREEPEPGPTRRHLRRSGR